MHIIIVFYFILLLIKTFSLVKTYLSILCMYVCMYVFVIYVSFVCLFIYLFTYLFAVRLNLADADIIFLMLWLTLKNTFYLF